MLGPLSISCIAHCLRNTLHSANEWLNCQKAGAFRLSVPTLIVPYPFPLPTTPPPNKLTFHALLKGLFY